MTDDLIELLLTAHRLPVTKSQLVCDKAAARIEALTAENERLREALYPFAVAAEKGRAVYVGVAMAMKEKPELFPYSTAYVDAGRTTASSHLTWNDYDEARIALTDANIGQPWLRTYDAHLKGGSE